jgi:hypothetical protein
MVTQENPDGTPGGGDEGPGPRSLKSVLIWTAVAAVGAVAWTVLAISRDETVSALWILFAALCSYAICLPLLRAGHHLQGARHGLDVQRGSGPLSTPR